MAGAALRPIALFAVAVTLAACAGRARSAAPPQSEVRIVAAEQREFDISLTRSPAAKNLVDSYHIDGEVLTILVDAAAWNRLTPTAQDESKRTVWRMWRNAYLRRHPETTDRVFLKVEDLQGNDLGSYFD